MKKFLLYRIFQKSTFDYIEYLEVFSNGDIEFAIYYPKSK